jgi:hypothetical protein
VLMLKFLDFQVNVCPGQAGRIEAIEVTGRMTGKPQVMPPGWQIAPDNRAWGVCIFLPIGARNCGGMPTFRKVSQNIGR